MGNNHVPQGPVPVSLDRIQYRERRPEPKYIYKYNILFIGEPGTGTKTSLIKRIKGGTYIENIKEYKENNEIKEYEIGINDELILYLIDTNGQKEKTCLIYPEKRKEENYINYYTNADIIVMGYDVTNRKSFEEIKSFWYKVIKDYNKTNLYLLGNKIDLNGNVEISENEIKEFTELNNIKHFFISVKNNININEFVRDIIRTRYNIRTKNKIKKSEVEIIIGLPSKKENKIVFLGDSQVGKTCFINVLVDGIFYSNLKNEEVLKYSIKDINLENENKIQLNIWDFTGQEKFRKIAPIMAKNSDCIILGYDITKRESFDNIKSIWLPLAKGSSDTDLIYLLGFKNDIYEERQVEDEDAQAYSQQNNLRFFPVSCRYESWIQKFLDDLTIELIKNK